ncbi:MAG: cupin domain-containing protein [Sphingomonadales bacterium]|nr:MAG: cupin domain-containing protein [Sphingomonadales bacterium]
MRITRRDLAIAAAAASCALAAGAVAQSQQLLGPTVIDWNKMEVKKTDVGAIRDLFRAPTATLDELEMHITTLNPGLSSHPPHTHPNEEIVIIREGTVEMFSASEWKRIGPGSVVFNASNSPHAIRNVGTTPATYHVINWKTPKSVTN